MPSTSVHFPAGLLEEIDHRAGDAGLSRNRFIVESCRRALSEGRTEWPAEFFSNERFTKADLRELRESARAFERAIQDGRQNRAGALF